MRLLLDTHAFLWWCTDSRRLRKTARTAIANAEDVFVSAVSAWEATIKVALGKLRLPEPLSAAVKASSFSELPVTFAHAEAVAALPMHHTDPFDRLLVAQARTEDLTLVTSDGALKPYAISLLWT